MHLLDPAFSLAARTFARLGLRPPVASARGPARAVAAADTVARFRPLALPLEPGLAHGDPRARAALADLAETALSAYHHALASAPRRLSASAEVVDRDFHRPDLPEILDDPDVDPEVRRRIMRELHELNGVIGSYDTFLAELRPWLRPDGLTRILDLAAGHGGFARHIAAAARRHGWEVEVTATDRQPQYLALGEAAARAEGLPVRFAVQDALDLGNLAPGSFDLIVSTQSLHHFPSGLVARLIDEAARKATRGVLLFDGCRSLLSAGLLALLSGLRGHHPALLHDALVSCRRFPVPEELAVLAGVCPAVRAPRARLLPPGHVVVEIATGGRTRS